MSVRQDFPFLNNLINRKPLIYFDNAATTQKPRVVIKALTDFYLYDNANSHSRLNPLGEQTNSKYERAKETIARFIKADANELIITASATAGINLVARTWGEKNLHQGDIVILSLAEHHANIVSWLQLKKRRKIIIKYIDLNNNGTFNLSTAASLLKNKRVKLLAITQVSNVLGIINPVSELIEIARKKGITTLIDASQSIMHLPIDLRKLKADFLVFSGHKIYGPLGVGILYVRQKIMSNLPIFYGGGGMIERVSQNSFITLTGSEKFSAGTPNLSGVIALAAACNYINKKGWRFIKKQEKDLSHYLGLNLKALKFVKIIGPIKKDIPLFSVVIDDVHPHDAADLLGQEGIITRAGHHCAQPLHDYFKLTASLRFSLSFYNTKQEIDKLITSLKKIHIHFTL